MKSRQRPSPRKGDQKQAHEKKEVRYPFIDSFGLFQNDIGEEFLEFFRLYLVSFIFLLFFIVTISNILFKYINVNEYMNGTASNQRRTPQIQRIQDWERKKCLYQQFNIPTKNVTRELLK